MSAWHDIAAEADVTVGNPAIARIGGREIGVMRDPRTNDLIAIRNRCPHSGARLCLGTVAQRIEGEVGGDYQLVDRTVVVCPWHGWEFDASTGECIEDPSFRVAAYPVRVEDGRVLVQA
jgi:3-phenylpropionate/trans-cinnamate dioxygenase ferredoxin subunit